MLLWCCFEWNIFHCFYVSVVLLLLVPRCGATCPSYSYNTRIFQGVNCQLTEVPRDIPADALEVWLEGNRITSIPARVFSHLSQCTYLRLFVNNIASIVPESFAGLQSLRTLYLFSNELTFLPAGVFRHLSNCTSLWLYKNGITFLDPESFAGLQSLQRLYVYNNELTCLTAGVFSHLPNCTHFQLQSKLQAFAYLVSLQTLQLNRNRISHIDFLTGLTKLTHFYISHNQVSTIETGAFDTLSSLTYIELYGNRLTTLSPDLFLNLPRPFELVLKNPQDTETNSWDCNALCWLNHELHHGTATSHICGSSWSPQQCGNPGELHSYFQTFDLSNNMLSASPWSLHGSWITLPGVCAEPGGVPFSTRSGFPGAYNLGDQVTYNCYDGEKGTITCQSDGKWIQKPRCSGEKCSPCAVSGSDSGEDHSFFIVGLLVCCFQRHRFHQPYLLQLSQKQPQKQEVTHILARIIYFHQTVAAFMLNQACLDMWAIPLMNCHLILFFTLASRFSEFSNYNCYWSSFCCWVHSGVCVCCWHRTFHQKVHISVCGHLFSTCKLVRR